MDEISVILMAAGLIGIAMILCVVKIYQATQSIDKKMDQILERLDTKKDGN